MPSPLDDRAIWARFAQSRAVLETVATSLAGAGVQVLAVKGIVTSGWLYDTPEERPLSDIDIRIRPRDFGAALALVDARGWRVARRVWAYRNLIFEVNGVTVDLESYVGPPGVAAVSVDAMLERATRDPGGFWVPEAYDHSVLLTVNVFKDKLRWAFPWAVQDVVRVVETAGFDAAVYVDRVRRARVAGLAWVVADWVVATHGSARWSAIRTLLGGDAPERAVYTRLARRLFAADDVSSLPARLLVRAASDDASRWPGAMARAAAWEIESRLDARRRGIPRRW